MSTQIGMTPSDPYVTPSGGTFTGTPGSGVFEITLTTSLATAASPIVSGTTNVHAETYNGAIPGPTFRLTVGDTVIVRLVNNMPHETGIHWHGIELGNSADGTEVSQLGALGAPLQTLGNGVPAGGTYLYKFKVTRPGIFWYHPHHHHSTNRVFKGLYGMIVVTDLEEEALVGTTLPSAADTKQLVLSDITVCTTPPNPDAYAALAGAEWLSGATAQTGPLPADICELPNAVDDHGDPAGADYAAGDVPSLETTSGRVNEGQTVLTNGVNVGGRAGSPSAPGALAAGAYKLPVRPGQGLRLQILNCATTRYFRLRLTDAAGQKVDLVRVGGEGGVLDNAVLEGLTPPVPAGTFNPKYDSGEILLPPSVRADVVAVIPDTLTPGSVLTLWTRDFERLLGAPGGPFAQLPTVPVMHLEVTNVTVEAYSIAGGPNGVGGTPLRASLPGPPLVDALGAPNGTLLNPATFSPTKPGNPANFVPPAPVSEISDIKLTSGTPSINGIPGHDLHGPPPYPNTPHIESSRYAAAAVGRILELTVTNMSQAHHPFHLHGFSMQPISLTRPANPTFTWGYREFRDSIDVPSNYTLTFRIRLDDRELVDGETLGGWLGRWLFHCHIFFHHHRGMISEFVVTDNNGKERPYVDVGGSWAFASSGGTTTRHGTYSSLDGSTPISLAASYGPAGGPITGPLGSVVPASGPGGSWSWTNPVVPDGIYYVYIKATDSIGLQGQAVFRLKVGGADDGSDVGDPHIHTVDGKEYAFQAVGEFMLLRDRDGLEIQTRQTPLESANPFTDNYSGLTSSVSVNTAVAARVGSHRISYQPSGVGGDGQLQFFLDGKPARLSTEGIDLESHRVSAFDANGEMGLRVDYAHGAVLTVTPRFWFIWFLDIWVSHTHADEGIMGSIPENTWLPTLPSGATVGPMPESLHDRYIVLYKTFADAWRLTDETSLFVYAKGTSTETFTDKDWPAEEPPSILKPQFKIPGFPTPVNIPVAEAEQICQGVTIADLHANCVFDVGTTGDKGFAKAYLLQQDLRLHGSTVQIAGDKESTRPGESLVVTAIVLPMTNGRPTPTGSVTFMVDGVAAGPPVKIDEKGRAQHTLDHLDAGEHKIRASYTSDGGDYHSSTSPNLLHMVEKGPGSTGGSTFGCWWVIWILIILILIAIAAYLYFS
ncbi:MAG TPA: multicopper oxidase domain-containing protein [Thermoanaerobaculia bacterium]|nr:multicopper oxidase domain-containing protein [Thermoanaerobaculia bacterium]